MVGRQPVASEVELKSRLRQTKLERLQQKAIQSGLDRRDKAEPMPQVELRRQLRALQLQIQALKNAIT